MGVCGERWNQARFCVRYAPLLLLSCSPRLPAERADPILNNQDQPVLESDAVELVEVPDRPTLQIVRRKGDPRPGLGVAVFPEGGSVETVALTALFRARLARASIQASFQPNSLATVFVVHPEYEGGLKALLKALYTLLHTEVTAEEVESLRLSQHWDALLNGASLEESPVGLCAGELGAEGEALLRDGIPGSNRTGWLEQVRKRAVTARRLAFSAVGDEQLARAVVALHELPWEAGARLDDSWDGTFSTRVLPLQGARELRVALRLADSKGALAAARALRQSAHPIHARLSGVSSSYALSDVGVTLRPAGACVSTRLVLGEQVEAPSTEQLAAVALLISQEIEGTLAQSWSEEERSLALIEPQTVDETAALAAWAAVRSTLTGAKSARLVEYRGATSSSGPNTKQLTEAIQSAEESWAQQKLELLQRDERGQPQLYMMLASPCGTSAEASSETGLRALTVRTLAKQFTGTRGVQLAPYVQPHGVGLVAHGAKMRGESSDEHAARLARTLAGALSGRDVDGRVVAEARAEQLKAIGSDPGEALILSIFGGDAVSALAPQGNENVVSTLSTYDVERSREELAQEPLRLAVLNNSAPGQSVVAERSISQWLASERQHTRPCSTEGSSPAKPGQWTLETLEETVSTGAYIGVWAPVRQEVGFGFADFLHAHPSLLSPSGAAPPPPPPPGGLGDTEPTESENEPTAAALDLIWRGNDQGGALIVRVGAGAAALEEKVEQTRLALHELSAWGLKTEAVEAIGETFERRRAALSELPMGRLIQLWETPAPKAPTAAELRALSTQLAGDLHRVVLVKRRK